MSGTKFSDDDYTNLLKLREDYKNILMSIGQIELDKRLSDIEYDKSIKTLVSEHLKLVDIEKRMFDEIQKKYGDGSYDITTNTFTPLGDN